MIDDNYIEPDASGTNTSGAVAESIPDAVEPDTPRANSEPGPDAQSGTEARSGLDAHAHVLHRFPLGVVFPGTGRAHYRDFRVLEAARHSVADIERTGGNNMSNKREGEMLETVDNTFTDQLSAPGIGPAEIVKLQNAGMNGIRSWQNASDIEIQRTLDWDIDKVQALKKWAAENDTPSSSHKDNELRKAYAEAGQSVPMGDAAISTPVEVTISKVNPEDTGERDGKAKKAPKE